MPSSVPAAAPSSDAPVIVFGMSVSSISSPGNVQRPNLRADDIECIMYRSASMLHVMNGAFVIRHPSLERTIHGVRAFGATASSQENWSCTAEDRTAERAIVGRIRPPARLAQMSAARLEPMAR